MCWFIGSPLATAIAAAAAAVACLQVCLPPACARRHRYRCTQTGWQRRGQQNSSRLVRHSCWLLAAVPLVATRRRRTESATLGRQRIETQRSSSAANAESTANLCKLRANRRRPRPLPSLLLARETEKGRRLMLRVCVRACEQQQKETSGQRRGSEMEKK